MPAIAHGREYYASDLLKYYAAPPYHQLPPKITMADPVAAKSGFLCTYMSNHPDTLVAYAKWFGKVTDNISSAEMSAIDTKVGHI